MPEHIHRRTLLSAALSLALNRTRVIASLAAIAPLMSCFDNSGGSAGGNNNTGSPTGNRIDLSQIGGTNLSILAGLQAPVGVAADGTVTITTSDQMAQVLFVKDGAGGVRGLALKLPGQTLTVDATSTALALCFLVPGIVTADATKATARILLLRNAPSFAALVTLLASLLPTMTITQALPQLQALIIAVTEEAGGVLALRGVSATARAFAVTGEAGGVLARQDPFPAQAAILIRPGGLYVTPGTDLSPANGSFVINNESGRFVSVVRSVFNTRGQEFGTEATVLVGTPFPGTVFPGARSIIGAVNGFSVGNFLTGQTLTASHAQDNFSLLQHNPTLEHVDYYIAGVGNSQLADNAVLPPEVTPEMFSAHADVATLVLGIILPILEPVLGAGALLTKSPDELIALFPLLAVQSNAVDMVSSASTGGADNLASSLLSSFSSLLPIAEVAAAIAGLLGGGVLATFVTAAIETVELCMSVGNFVILARDIVKKPRYVAIQVPLPVGVFRDLVSEQFATVIDVNASGIALYQDNQGQVFEKKLFRGPVLIGGPISGASISDLDSLIAFQDNTSGAVKLRSDAGVVGGIPLPPNASGPSPSRANPKIDAMGKAVAANYSRTGATDILLFERSTGESISTFSPSAPGGPVSGLVLGGITESTVFGYSAGGGGPTSTLGRYSRTNRTWTTRQVAKSNSSSFARYVAVNKADEGLVFEYREFGNIFDGFGAHYVISIEGPGGIVEIARETSPIGGQPTARSLDAVGINDVGDILAIENDQNATPRTRTTVIFKTRGGSVSKVTLPSLAPAGTPGGNYIGEAIKGKFVLATRLVDSAPVELHIFFLGRSVEDVQRELAI